MKNKPLLWLVLLVAFLVLVVGFFASGCEVFKHYKSNKEDTTHLQKSTTETVTASNSGAVRKDSAEAKETVEWWRVIQQFASQPRDTSVTNNYYTLPAGQPATIIYEGGNGTREEKSGSIDSAWFAEMTKTVASAIDSMNRKLEIIENEKKKETHGVGLVTVILIAAGVVVVMKGLGWTVSNFSIVKKQRI